MMPLKRTLNDFVSLLRALFSAPWGTAQRGHIPPRELPPRPDAELVAGLTREAAPLGPRPSVGDAFVDEIHKLQAEFDAELAEIEAEHPEVKRPTTFVRKLHAVRGGR